ncbi:stalk domain-containing protein [Paenibacillus albidus]|uniref:stalk domain-containing protein n=1 Tax=Paenibacillus albidus TaxID=2041023 RepID=UPI00357179C9
MFYHYKFFGCRWKSCLINAVIRNGAIYMPLRAIVETFDLEANWDRMNKNVNVRLKQK